MHIFCTECGKHIDVSLEELENQNGHLVCPQCLAEIDVELDIFNGNAPDLPSSEALPIDTTEQQGPPAYPPIPPALPKEVTVGATPQTEPIAVSTPAEQPQSHIDDVIRYCKHCGAFLREGVNFCPKCGKYVRVTAPPAYKPPLTPAQQEAAKLRASTPPVRQIPANKQSTYRPPQDPTFQAIQVKQQRYPYNSTRNGARRSNASRSKNSSQPSKFSILSLGGCLTITIVAVALFFIIYIFIGVTYE